MLNRTIDHTPLPWYKTLAQYYQRPEWELFDLKQDPAEVNNLAGKPSLKEIQATLEARLAKWQRQTDDPWQCAPHGVLQDKGSFRDDPQCLTLGQ